jgi:putative hydrolase of the HAD superfamily
MKRGSSMLNRFEIPDFLEFVVFDLDGTLYRYEPCHKWAMKCLIDYINTETGINQSVIDKGLNESSERLKKRLGPTAASHSKILYVSDWIRASRMIVRASFIVQCEQIYWSNFIAKMIPREGMKEFLGKLRQKQIKTILITDLTLQIQLRKLVKLELDSAFDTVIASEEVAGDKLTGKGFELLSNFIGLKSEAWIFGDQTWDFPYSISNATHFNFGKKPSPGQISIENFLKFK